MKRHALGVNQLLVKARVLFFIKRTIRVIVAALIITCSHKRDRHINRIGCDYRRNRVVKVELVIARQAHDVRRQSFGRERPRCDDGNLFVRHARFIR